MTVLTSQIASQLVSEAVKKSPPGEVNVIIPEVYTSIQESAFLGFRITSVSIPNSVTIIGDSAFRGNDLESVTIPDSVTIIGDSAFSGNSLYGSRITIGTSVETIGEYAFLGNYLDGSSVTIPDSVRTLSNKAFASSSLFSYDEVLLLFGTDSSADNSIPTGLLLTDGFGFNLVTAFNENIEAGTTIGTLYSFDLDPGDEFDYSLVGESTDNEFFEIDDNQLKIVGSPDFESKQPYSLNIRTTDLKGNFFEKPFTLEVNDLVESTDLLTGMEVEVTQYETDWKRDLKQKKPTSDKFGFNGSNEKGTFFTIKNAFEDSLLSSGKDYSFALVQRNQTLDEAFGSSEYLLSESFSLNESTINYISFDSDDVKDFKASFDAKQKYDAIVFDETDGIALLSRGVGKLTKEASDGFDKRIENLPTIIDPSENFMG